MMSNLSAKLFHQLPIEVLTLIVDHVVTQTSTHWRCKRDFANLKALRLSSRSFSYIPRLLAILFRGIKLVAVPESLDHLEKADIGKLAPYVQRLTFFPSIQSWTLSFDDFKEIMVSQSIQRYCKDHREIPNRSNSLIYEEDGYSKFINRYWAGRKPFSNNELAAGYEKYQSLAAKGKDSLKSDALLAQWTLALKTLSTCREYRIDTLDYENGAPDIPELIDCYVYK